MRVIWTTTAILAAAVAAFGCSNTTPPVDAGVQDAGTEPACVATGKPCSVELPCCTGSCVDGFSVDAGHVCGPPPTFWIDGGTQPGTIPGANCDNPGSGQGESAAGCQCSGGADCLSASCANSLCCGLPGGNLYDSPPGCSCAGGSPPGPIDSDCLSGACSSTGLICCDVQGGANKASPAGCLCSGDSDCLSQICSSGVCSGGGGSSSGGSSSSTGGGSSSGGMSCGSSGNDAGLSSPGCACTEGGDCGSDVCSPTGQCCAPKGSNQQNSPIGCACNNGDCADGDCTNHVCG